MYNDSVKSISFKFNFLYILAYVIAYALFGVGIFIYLRSYIFLILLILAAILPFVSFAFLRILSKSLDISLFVSDGVIEVGSPLGVGITVNNKSIITSLNLKCYLSIYNDYYNEKCDQLITVPVLAKAQNKNPLICEAVSCGNIRVVLNKVCLTDLFGMFSYVYTKSQAVETDIIPVGRSLTDIDRLGLLSGYSDNEDDSKKGNEYSDTSNIREYIAGDRIKDIHWKLSSKRDILLVREHIKTCENKLLVWVDHSGRKKNNELILALTVAVAKYCISEGILLKLLWLSADNQTVNEYTVMSLGDCYDGLHQIYLDNTRLNSPDIKSVIINNDLKTDKLIKIGFRDNEVAVYAYEI